MIVGSFAVLSTIIICMVAGAAPLAAGEKVIWRL